MESQFKSKINFEWPKHLVSSVVLTLSQASIADIWIYVLYTCVYFYAPSFSLMLAKTLKYCFGVVLLIFFFFARAFIQ